MADYFSKEASLSYDEKNQRLAPIADGMHFLIRLALKDLPTQSRILCVGVGTGAEILSLSRAFPEWSFVGVDPSASMLEVCRERLLNAGVMNRCELVHGYVHDLPNGESFDAALSVLVGHFVKREERVSFYQGMISRLKKSGMFINTEISFDLESEAFPSMLKNWERVQTLMGGTAETLAKLPEALKNVLSVLPPNETETLIQQSGIRVPVRFFQAFMITGWYGQK